MLKAVLVLLMATSLTMVKAAPDAPQLVGTWYIASMVTDGATVATDALHTGEQYTFNADGTFDGVIEGTHYTGTYAIAPAGTWVTIYVAEDMAFRLMIISNTADALQAQMISGNGSVYTMNFDHTL